MAVMLCIVVGQKTVWACVILNMVYYSGCNVVCIVVGQKTVWACVILNMVDYSGCNVVYCSWTEDSLGMCNTKYGGL